jgi:Fe2+ transport system protein FeoA
MTLDQVVPGSAVIIEQVGGARSFRRRLMELGLIPGIKVEVLRIAPFGDPLELSVRGCNLSIRAAEAKQVVAKRVEVEPLEAALPASVAASNPPSASASAGSARAPSRAWESARPRAVSGLAKSAP